MRTSDQWLVYDEQDPWHVISRHDRQDDAENAAWLMSARFRYGTPGWKKLVLRLLRATPRYRVERVSGSRRDDAHRLPDL